ncbi:MAG: discoidin domain-containing protein [Acidobacteriota bacterium]
MKRTIAVVLSIVLLAAVGYVVVRGRPPAPGTVPPPPAEGAASSGASADAASSGQVPATPGPGSAPGTATPVPAARFNLASPEFGGHIESVSSEADREDHAAIHLIDRGQPVDSSWQATATPPQEVVIGFFKQQSALVDGVVIDPNTHTSVRWPKDVEVWTSMESATSGFVKAAAQALSEDDREQEVRFPPVEARFVKVRLLSVHGAGDRPVGTGKVKVLEAQAPGYAPLLVRNPDLGRLISVPAPVVRTSAAAAPPVATADGAPASCALAEAPPAPPAHLASANVLVLARSDARYPPLRYAADTTAKDHATSIYGRLAMTRIAPGAASPMLLDAAHGYDTVVLSQVCDIGTSVPESFKRALVNWVGDGHKLIIHDSDLCDADHVPDYSFLPYRFSTSNPGKQGASSEKLIFVDENSLANSNPDSPAFLDVDAWTGSRTAGGGGGDVRNELGDSNTVKDFDDHWCGSLMTRNVLKENGFVEAYAHYGRGLIVYDGFDYDQAGNAHYRRLVTNELAQPFAPDGLGCSARLSGFLVTTEGRLRTQDMAAGRTYHYPLSVLSHRGYKGTVTLTAAVEPADPAITATLDRDAVDVADAAVVSLTVAATAAAAPSERTIAVRGVDADGRSNLLCLRLSERLSGALRVVSALPRPSKAKKNIEIILDLSGSMKLPLGRSTRIATARKVLRDVLARLPDDFNVGLRVYGHRYGPTQPQTCTDSELVVPIARLDRERLLKVIDSTQPRGETPLVYSVLQTAADLKAAGGGSVILITDGEESCHGDPAAAARQLQASGVSLELQILGFTLNGRRVQQQLSQFAEATGGHYYSAQDGASLGRALLMAAVDSVPFTVFNAAGRQVATGQSDGEAIDLPPGEYKVSVQAPDQLLVADRVTVAARGQTSLTLVLNNGRLEIRR